MFQKRKLMDVDLIVFAVCCWLGTWYTGFEMGRQYQPKVCAKVMGMQAVSSTADECTYIMGTQGKAYWKFLAKEESKK